MEFTGKVIAVLPEKTGVSKSSGNEWKAQEYVIEDNGQYPRKMCFEVFGADKIAQFGIQVGQELTVSFDIDARQWKDRWFNSIRAWKVVPAQAAGAPTQAADPFPAAPQFSAPADSFGSNAGGSNDDLPF